MCRQMPPLTHSALAVSLVHHSCKLPSLAVQEVAGGTNQARCTLACMAYDEDLAPHQDLLSNPSSEEIQPVPQSYVKLKEQRVASVEAMAAVATSSGLSC